MWIYYLTKFRWVIGAIGLAASLFSIASYFEQRGYNKAIVELQLKTNKAVQEATKKAINKANEEMEKALNAQQDVFDRELERVKNERVVETKVKEIYRDVDKIIIKNECTTFDSSIMQLLNNSVNNSNSASN